MRVSISCTLVAEFKQLQITETITGLYFRIGIEMSVIREFSCFDLFKFNKVNLDPLTETYGLTFYMTYQAKWPEYFYTAESPNGEIQGYIMGKAEVLLIFLCTD